jgi:hypothetical protein
MRRRPRECCREKRRAPGSGREEHASGRNLVFCKLDVGKDGSWLAGRAPWACLGGVGGRVGSSERTKRRASGSFRISEAGEAWKWKGRPALLISQRVRAKYVPTERLICCASVLIAQQSPRRRRVCLHQWSHGLVPHPCHTLRHGALVAAALKIDHLRSHCKMWFPHHVRFNLSSVNLSTKFLVGAVPSLE